jgi:hypothetical protein
MSLMYLQTLLEAPELVGADRETAEAARTRAINIVHPGKLDELERERAAVQLLTNATAGAADAMRDLAELPNAHALNDFLNQSVPDSGTFKPMLSGIPSPRRRNNGDHQHDQTHHTLLGRHEGS